MCAPGWTRTSDLPVSRQALFLSELRGHSEREKCSPGATLLALLGAVAPGVLPRHPHDAISPAPWRNLEA